ncbi:MAG: VOC family protein [Pseudomonadota bacterium]
MALKNPVPVRALGEIAIRCSDLPTMRAFYRDVVGLEVLRDFSEGSGIVFFRISEGFGGHTAVLALFSADAEDRRALHPTGAKPETGARSSLHHLALTVARDQQGALEAYFTEIGLAYRVEVFDWIGWRGTFVTDPEGNTVEFVAGPA